VEVIVAMMIVTIGLLGIAGSTALALRTTVEATRRREVVERAQSRIAQLAAAGCANASSGSATDVARSVSEQWSVRPSGSFQQITDSITWMSAHGPGTFALTSAVAC
jgi:Tfp pilus assembly protein PilV